MNLSSICVSDPFRGIRWVVNGWEHSHFTVANVSDPEILSFLCKWKFHQKLHDVIGAGVWSFVPFSKAWVMVFVLHVCQSAVWASIILSGSVMTVGAVASEPFLESHCTHDVVIGHWVKTVKCTFYFLLGADTALEGSCNTCVRKASPVHDFFFFKTPWLEKKSVDIVGFNKLIPHWSFVKEEDLRYGMDLPCWRVWTSPWVDTFTRLRQFSIWILYCTQSNPCLSLCLNLPHVLKS